MIPQIDTILNTIPDVINYPSYTYKCTDEQIVGKVDGKEAIKQAVYHILRTERYAYPIYDDNYGVELEKYIGQDFSYIEATIEQTLREALTQDDRIVDVEVTSIEQTIQEQQMIDKTLRYKDVEDEIDENLIDVEHKYGNIITDRQKISPYQSISKAKVVEVKFNVYCRQGVIEMEVKVNV